jgi:hypothetical protein
MKQITLYSLFIFAILFSCKKKEIEDLPVSNEPAFKAEGTLNGESFSIIAGEEDAYMNTYTELINGVNKFSGNLTDGSTEIKIGFYDGKINNIPKILSQSDLQSLIWDIDYNTPLAVLSKNLFSNSSKINSIEWYSDEEYLGPNTYTFTKPGKYNIKAIVTFNDGSIDTLENILVLGYNTIENYSLKFNLTSNGDLNSWIEIDNGTVESRTWKLDGITINTSDNNFITNIDDQIHELSVTVKFTNGVTRTKKIHVDGDFTNGYHLSDFTVCELDPINKDALKRDFKALLIIKKDNIEYRSDYIGNTSGSISINSIDYFGLNTAGKKVYRFSAHITSNLKNTTINQIIPVNFNTILGVEIP